MGRQAATIGGAAPQAVCIIKNGGNADMWQTIGWLTLGCAVFIGMLISLSIIGLKI